jgi:hypothetical protein
LQGGKAANIFDKFGFAETLDIKIIQLAKGAASIL